MTLSQRGDGDFLIKLDHYILMNSQLSLSERLLAESACGLLGGAAEPRVLLGGLGMGCTLRAALDALPAGARVVVAELNPVVVRWCRGPLRGLTDGAVDDPRVEVEIADVAEVIARGSGKGKFDAIVLDLYQGTHDANTDPDDPFYGRAALERARLALVKGGVFAAWTEERDVGFEARFKAAVFILEEPRRARSGPGHVVYLGRA